MVCEIYVQFTKEWRILGWMPHDNLLGFTSGNETSQRIEGINPSLAVMMVWELIIRKTHARFSIRDETLVVNPAFHVKGDIAEDDFRIVGKEKGGQPSGVWAGH